MSVTLPNITSGWLDAIDQEKLGELHEIFMMMTPLKIDYADYVDYVITLITVMVLMTLITLITVMTLITPMTTAGMVHLGGALFFAAN